MKRLLTVLLIILSVEGSTQPKVPGVVINHSPAHTGVYLGGPSVVILGDGTYLSTHTEFGPNSQMNSKPKTLIYHSLDKGQTWTEISVLEGNCWSGLFVHNYEIYLMGVSKKYGDLIIRKSTDNGYSWTEPADSQSGLLRNDFEYHSAPVPVVRHQGRLYRAVEVRNPGYGWGTNFETLIVSAAVDSDLLSADSWQTSNRLHFDQRWLGSAWLEGNIVVTPDSQLVNMLRLHYLEHGGKAALVRYDIEKNIISFDEKSDIINFPGGAKKFTVRYDPRSKRYWTLSNHIRDFGHNPERTRNCLALSSSPDLLNWTVHEEILYHPDVHKHGFQYADWQFDEHDIVAVIRTAFDDEYEGADNQHNSNYIIFNRIVKFRSKLDLAIASYCNP